MAADPTPRDMLYIALTYSSMGEIDASIHWLELAYENKSDWLPWIVLRNAFGGAVEPMRDHSRFKTIVEKLNLPSSEETIIVAN